MSKKTPKYYCFSCNTLVEPEREDSELCASCEEFEFNQISNWELEDYTRGFATAQKEMVKAIEDEIYSVSNPLMVDREFLDGLERALELIKGEQK
jgi:hypothetical protein